MKNMMMAVAGLAMAVAVVLSEVDTEAENAPGAHQGLGKPGLRGSRFRWLWVGVDPSCAPGGRHCQILKDDAVKVLHSICQQIWKTQQWPQYWKRSVFIPIPKKSNAKECSNRKVT